MSPHLDPASASLSDAELSALEVERAWWRFGSTKDDAVRARLGLAHDDYHRLLTRLIERPAALEADPALVRRLRRARDVRRAQRSERRRSA